MKTLSKSSPTPSHSLPRLILVTLALLSLAICAHASFEAPQPWRIQDQITTDTQDYSLRLDGVTSAGAVTFYAVDDGIHGRELWRTDGTASGTSLVKDIAPGKTDSSPSDLVLWNGTLFFTANDGSHGRELWKSDGYASGTQLVKDLYAGTESAISYSPYLSPDHDHPILAACGPGLFLLARDREDREQLWKTDGTESGTLLLMDLPSSATNPSLDNLYSAGNLLYFAADDGSHGKELWRSNGSPTGTRMVRDINLSGSSDPWVIGMHEGILLLSIDTKASPWGYTRELWRSDGTQAGTFLLSSISKEPGKAAYMDGWSYFAAIDSEHGRELWRTKGTGLTSLHLEIAMGSSINGNHPPFSSDPMALTPVNGTLFFTANDPTEFPFHIGGGRELYMTGRAGEGLIREIGTYPCQSGLGNADYSLPLLTWQNRLFLLANDGQIGQELWQSDGTSTGTIPFLDINPGPGSGALAPLAAANGVFLFTGYTETDGYGVWRSDGTTSGTFPIQSIDTDKPYPMAHLEHIGDSLYFDTYTRLWKINGLQSRLYQLRQVASGETNPFALNGSLFALVTCGNESGLWGDGSSPSSSMKLVKRLYPGRSSPCILQGTAWFSATPDTDDPYALWKTDGSETGTAIVKEGISPSLFASMDNTLYFPLVPNNTSLQLWISNGTASGTQPVLTVAADMRSKDITQFVTLNGRFAFTCETWAAEIKDRKTEFWISDGTASGTMLLQDINPAPAPVPPSNLTVVGDTLFFAAQNAHQDMELWKSDGTAQGTVRVRDINPGIASSSPDSLANINGTLFFSAVGAVSGRELWKSDGTSAGTTRVKDITPGPEGSLPQHLTPIPRTHLFVFAASDGEHGMEPWVSDGTAAGTRLLCDITPGTDSSNPSDFVTDNTCLYFIVNQSEIWAIPLSDFVPASTGESWKLY